MYVRLCVSVCVKREKWHYFLFVFMLFTNTIRCEVFFFLPRFSLYLHLEIFFSSLRRYRLFFASAVSFVFPEASFLVFAAKSTPSIDLPAKLLPVADLVSQGSDTTAWQVTITGAFRRSCLSGGQRRWGGERAWGWGYLVGVGESQREEWRGYAVGRREK